MFHRYLSFLLSLILLFTFVNPVYAQQSTDTYPVYIVESGDTFNSIAQKFDVSVNDLMAVNNIADLNFLNIGMRINIPGYPGVTGVLQIKTLNVGETFSSFSSKYDISPSQLAQLNKITSPTSLFAGSELIVPVNEDQKDFPSPSSISQLSLIESSMVFNHNPWSTLLKNSISSSWDLLPGDDYFPVSQNDENNSSNNLIKDISINPFPLIQGSTEVIHIQTNRPASITANLSGHQIGFFKLGENDYYAFEGIHALDQIGLKNLDISATEDSVVKTIISQPVLLKAGIFINETVNGVDSNSVDPKAIEEEDNILKSISNTSAEKLWDGPFDYPVDEPCLGSTFGNRRTYNDGALNYYHTGVDFSVCANNLNIYAVAPGTVIFTGMLPTKGNYTLIDHGWGVYTGYAHQSEFKVQVGDHVSKRQIIGQIGTTGRSLGPHLHWEVWVNHIPVDPLPWLEGKYLK